MAGQQEIKLTDVQRIFIGDAPPEFLLEVFIRTLVIYIALLVVFRLMGKRMTGQLTLSELAVTVMLGAIVAPVAQLPDRGILFGLITLSCAVVFQRGLNFLEFKNRYVENLTQGNISLLVKDGVMQLHEMGKSGISKQQLFAQLREKEILNLGSVKRVYLEASGDFTIYKNTQTNIGLPVFPPGDNEICKIEHEIEGNSKACADCGNVMIVQNDSTNCSVCGNTNWTKAYLYIIKEL